jgi:sensor histidine kinase YesM
MAEEKIAFANFSSPCRVYAPEWGKMEKVYLYIIIALSIISVISIYFLVNTKRKYNKKYNKYFDELLEKQMNEVNQIYLTMRGWRHDYHNHMQKIKVHVALNQLEELEKYLSELESDLDKVDVKYKTGNIGLDAILNSKLALAENMGININCKVQLNDLDKDHIMKVSNIDLCVLFGNLIDNAIEACEKISKDKKFIRIYMCTMKEQLYLSVTNSTSEKIRRIDKEYISNKRGNHGHGLRRIDNIVEKYEGYINRKNEPEVFATEVMLPL